MSKRTDITNWTLMPMPETHANVCLSAYLYLYISTKSTMKSQQSCVFNAVCPWIELMYARAAHR